MREIYEYIEDVASNHMTASDAADEILEITVGELGKKIKDVVTAPIRAAKEVKKLAKGPEHKLGGKLRLSGMRQWQDPGEVSKYGTKVKFTGKKVYGLEQKKARA